MKINIIGRGNVGWHLCRALESNADCREVNPHTLQGQDPEADITLISVSDKAIADVIEALPPMPGMVAHTSGSTGMDIFAPKASKFGSHGVFYPLQTFTKGKALDYTKIPFFIEASSPEGRELLRKTALLISRNVYDADSQRRRQLHVASVFACNFVNHLWTLSDKYLHEHGMDISVLIPLIEETAAKLHSLPPAEAQTGPAARRDFNIIESHEASLEAEDPELAGLYRIFSDSIINTRQK